MQTSIKSPALDQNRIIKALESMPDRIPLFTPFEDSMIKKYYKTKGAATLAKVLNKAQKQIYNRYHNIKGR